LLPWPGLLLEVLLGIGLAGGGPLTKGGRSAIGPADPPEGALLEALEGLLGLPLAGRACVAPAAPPVGAAIGPADPPMGAWLELLLEALEALLNPP